MNTNRTARELDFLRAKVATLEQLLTAYEDTVSGHARRLDDIADRTKTQASMVGGLSFATDPMNTGDFFHSLVYILATITGAKYVVAGELAGDDPMRIDTLAVWGAYRFRRQLFIRPLHDPVPKSSSSTLFRPGDGDAGSISPCLGPRRVERRGICRGSHLWNDGTSSRRTDGGPRQAIETSCRDSVRDDALCRQGGRRIGTAS